MLTPLDTGLISGLTFAWAVLALTAAFRLLSFPDITVEGSMPLGAASYAAAVQAGLPLSLATAAALATGAVAGALTAMLHSKFEVNKLLAGIIVISIAYTGCLRIMGASNIGLLQFGTLFDWVDPLNQLADTPFHLGEISLLTAILSSGCGLLLVGLMTEQGLRMRVAGANPEYARSLGIDVPVHLTLGLSITNSLAALSGVLLANRQGFADVGMGQGVLILALASMAIGERLVPNRSLSFPAYVLLAAVSGSIVYQVIVSYAVWMGVPSTDMELLTALLVLAVVARTTSQDESEPLIG